MAEGRIAHQSTMGAGENPEDVAQQEEQVHLVDGEGQASEEVEASVGVSKRSRRCIGTPPWLGVATLVLLVVGVYGLTWISKSPLDATPELPEGANPAAFPASRPLNNWRKFHKKHKAQAEEIGESVRFLALGDSITEELLGTACGSPKENWGSTEVWVKYYEELGALNLGVSGDQTQHLLWRMQNGELPDVLQPESIMVAIGTNNIGTGMSVQEAVGGIQAVIQNLREQRPDARIVFVALFPRASLALKSDPTPWPLVDEVNNLVEHNLELTYGGGMVHFINCNKRFLTTDSEGRQVLSHKMIMKDNLHLTPAGLKEWAECVSEEIRLGLTDA